LVLVCAAVAYYLLTLFGWLTSNLLCTVLYTVEFQKRGLPHIHCLVWLAAATSEFIASTIDNFRCVEIPDINIDPLGYSLVDKFMMHGPCGDDNLKCPCMKDNKCSKNFPKSFRLS
jgi:hypothetical protein